MLDLSDPKTPHIIAAAGLLGRFQHYALAMVADRTSGRTEHRVNCHNYIERIKALNEEHFQASAFIATRVADLEKLIDELSTMKTWTADDGHCPTCGSALKNLSSIPDAPPDCESCVLTILNALEPLQSDGGFGTWAC